MILCVAMVLAMLPVTALAEGDAPARDRGNDPADTSSASEQFNLTPGGTYYFDLSAQNIPGTLNTSLPDSSLKWVPCTYVGTVKAYSRGSEGISNDANVTIGFRSLFVAEHNATNKVPWTDLDDRHLIFGKSYASGGISYTLRAMSVGSDGNDNSGEWRGIPASNEWDQVLDKGSSYIQNWNDMYSWGQDTDIQDPSNRAYRGYQPARCWNCGASSDNISYLGFRPALEIMDPDTLDYDGLRTVTYDMAGKGTLGAGTLTSATVVYTGTLTLPEIISDNGFSYTGSGSGPGTLGWYDGSAFYAPGAEVSLSAGVTLTPRVVTDDYEFDAATGTLTIKTNGATEASSIGFTPVQITGRTTPASPRATS